MTAASAEQMTARLRAAGLRVTAPRVTVLRVLSAHPHSTADTVARYTREILGRVSTQAVYDVLAACTAASRALASSSPAVPPPQPTANAIPICTTARTQASSAGKPKPVAATSATPSALLDLEAQAQDRHGVCDFMPSPGEAPALSGPICIEPPASIHTSDPPPAPTSARSIAGTFRA